MEKNLLLKGQDERDLEVACGAVGPVAVCLTPSFLMMHGLGLGVCRPSSVVCFCLNLPSTRHPQPSEESGRVA